MSVREYEITGPAKIAELQAQLADALFGGRQIKLEARAVADDLSIRREGGERVRSFSFMIESIVRVPEGLQVAAQDVGTTEWATLTITDTVTTITVVS